MPKERHVKPTKQKRSRKSVKCAGQISKQRYDGPQQNIFGGAHQSRRSLSQQYKIRLRTCRMLREPVPSLVLRAYSHFSSPWFGRRSILPTLSPHLGSDRRLKHALGTRDRLLQEIFRALWRFSGEFLGRASWRLCWCNSQQLESYL